jgi:hypothetical protein
MVMRFFVLILCLILWLDGLVSWLTDLSFTQQQWLFATVGTISKRKLNK